MTAETWAIIASYLLILSTCVGFVFASQASYYRRELKRLTPKRGAGGRFVSKRA